MKTLIKSFAFALTLGIVTSAATFAETNPGSNPDKTASYQSAVYTTNSGKISIALDKQKGSTADIKLKNNNGQVLYSYHLGKNENTYRSRLSVNELPDGVYQVEISNGSEVTTHTVTVSTQQPTAPSRVISLK
ncbi:PPC domain-containing protein [Spirosoma aerolatum]|uniref:PPC domain-containing protein n=1 Tax=Spirosoma aerolatum TaxID=1211326 RepID=UPI0009AC9560|nr:PPC domain-containing protein [Spirosoma aerolatum]